MVKILHYIYLFVEKFVHYCEAFNSPPRNKIECFIGIRVGDSCAFGDHWDFTGCFRKCKDNQAPRSSTNFSPVL